MLGRLFQQGNRVGLDCLIGEGSDGPTVEQCVDGLVVCCGFWSGGFVALPGSTGGLGRSGHGAIVSMTAGGHKTRKAVLAVRIVTYAHDYLSGLVAFGRENECMRS